MNDKCKYCLTIKTCPEMCEENSIYCGIHRRFPKNVDKTFAQLQQENQKYKEVIGKVLEYIEAQDNFVDYKDYDNKPLQELYDIIEILKEVG